jgi:hypothetical protein
MYTGQEQWGIQAVGADGVARRIGPTRAEFMNMLSSQSRARASAQLRAPIQRAGDAMPQPRLFDPLQGARPLAARGRGAHGSAWARE